MEPKEIIDQYLTKHNLKPKDITLQDIEILMVTYSNAILSEANDILHRFFENTNKKK